MISQRFCLIIIISGRRSKTSTTLGLTLLGYHGGRLSLERLYEESDRYTEMMKQYYVYILECSDGTYYTGVTNNYRRRLQEHEQGIHSDSYTAKRLPFQLAYLETFRDIRKAIAREKQLKTWSRAKKDALIIKNIDQLHILATCINTTHYILFKPIASSIFIHRKTLNKVFSPKSGRAEPNPTSPSHSSPDSAAYPDLFLSAPQAHTPAPESESRLRLPARLPRPAL